jgi:uncharacterized membrane protein
VNSGKTIGVSDVAADDTDARRAMLPIVEEEDDALHLLGSTMNAPIEHALKRKIVVKEDSVMAFEVCEVL